MGTVWRVLTRKKIADSLSAEEVQCRKVLNVFDLTTLGVGSSLGVGVYVILGLVSRDVAGPAAILSLLIAFAVSALSGLCYCEFKFRVPREGSAYFYSYLSIGEFIAFIVGWNMLLEYIIGSASICRGLSLYLDYLLDNDLTDAFSSVAPIDLKYASSYFDFLAFGIAIFASMILAFGLRQNINVHNVFTCFNVLLVIFIIIAGCLKADGKNWEMDPPPGSAGNMDPGFSPYGIDGIIKGAAMCFYGFLGHEYISAAGREVKSYEKAVPIALILSLVILFLSYFGVSTVITLMVPYYLQDANASVPHAFEFVGLEVPKWITAIGGILALSLSLAGAMFPVKRTLYSMATEGLVFQFLGETNNKLRTPYVGLLLCGVLTGLLAALLELKELVNLMSIGTLLAYTAVAVGVLMLRYSTSTVVLEDSICESQQIFESESVSVMDGIKQVFNCRRPQTPNRVSERVVSVEVFMYCILCIALASFPIFWRESLSNGELPTVVISSFVLFLFIIVLLSIWTQPQCKAKLSFKVPLVPLIPALNIFANIYLMLMLDAHTWIRLGIWMLIGIPTYYFSVKSHYDARNMSMSSKYESNLSNGTNNIVNNGFDDHLPDVKIGNDFDVEKSDQKKISQTPPSPENVRSTIAMLDEILDNEASKLEDINSIGEVPSSPIDDGPKVIAVLSESPTLERTEMAVNVSSNDLMTFGSLNLNKEAPSNVEPSMSPKLENYLGTEERSDSQYETENVANKEEYGDKNNDETKVNTIELIDSSMLHSKGITDLEETPIQDTSSTIPVPPPIENLIIPQPQKFKIYSHALSGVKLKSLERPQYATPYPEPSDYLVFGTPEHKAFLEKLNKNLEKQVLPVTHVVPPIGVPVEDVPVKKSSNEDVIEDNISLVKARESLLKFIEISPSYLLTPPLGRNRISKESTSGIVSEEDDISTGDDTSLNDFREQHRRNMGTIFSSIRLRNKNKDEATATVREEDDNSTTGDDVSLKDFKEQHRRNMGSIFSSIRLRNNHIGETTTAREEEDHSSNTTGDDASLNDYKEQHRRNMGSIFSSIRLKNNHTGETTTVRGEEDDSSNTTGDDASLNDYKEQHRKNMGTIFSSIRLRNNNKSFVESQ